MCIFHSTIKIYSKHFQLWLLLEYRLDFWSAIKNIIMFGSYKSRVSTFRKPGYYCTNFMLIFKIIWKQLRVIKPRSHSWFKQYLTEKNCVVFLEYWEHSSYDKKINFKFYPKNESQPETFTEHCVLKLSWGFNCCVIYQVWKNDQNKFW